MNRTLPNNSDGLTLEKIEQEDDDIDFDPANMTRAEKAKAYMNNNSPRTKATKFICSKV